jgi:alpha-mannosidase
MINNFRTNFQPVQVTDALFRYRLTTTGQPPAGRDFGWAASSPLLPVCVQGPQAGDMPPSAGFCEVDTSNVLLLALKAAEDGDGLILRLAETEGRQTLATIHLPAYEIDQAFQTNLVEENTGVVWSDRHQVHVALSAYATVTIRCRGARRWPVVRAFWYD